MRPPYIYFGFAPAGAKWRFEVRRCFALTEVFLWLDWSLSYEPGREVASANGVVDQTAVQHVIEM